MADILSDRGALHKVEALFLAKCVTPFDGEYTSPLESLSFSRICFDGQERAEIKRAWTGFLRQVFESDTAWEWPCNVGIAEWYAAHERPLHAIAVSEHLLKQIQRKGLDESEREYISEFQEWLQRLFQLCQRQRLTERALHVAGLIGDYHEQGFFGSAEYAEVIASIPTLQHHEANEIIEKECDETVRRYRHEFGDLLAKLHPETARCLILAERVSVASIRGTDPSAAPLCWTLAIESEFHHKVYERIEIG